MKWFPDFLDPFVSDYSNKSERDVFFWAIQENITRFVFSPGGFLIQNFTLLFCLIFNREETISWLLLIWNGLSAFMQPRIGVLPAQILSGLLIYFISLPLSIIVALAILISPIILAIFGV